MRNRCIMMQLKMRDPPADERREIALLLGVTPNQFTYGENFFPDAVRSIAPIRLSSPPESKVTHSSEGSTGT